jgi:hypothetical protein
MTITYKNNNIKGALIINGTLGDLYIFRNGKFYMHAKVSNAFTKASMKTVVDKIAKEKANDNSKYNK